jgi:hypothetical protein
VIEHPTELINIKPLEEEKKDNVFLMLFDSSNEDYKITTNFIIDWVKE